jgi:hypothetical protein
VKEASLNPVALIFFESPAWHSYHGDANGSFCYSIHMVTRQTQTIIRKIAKHTGLDGGVTFDFRTLEFVRPKDCWYFPKYPGRTKIVEMADLVPSLESFIANNQKLLLEEDVVFGTWINPESNKVYIDLNTSSASKAEATALAKKLSVVGGRKIVSMYNPFHGVTEHIVY